MQLGQILQLNALRPTCDQFAAQLRTQLRAALPLMKSLKPLSRTFYSEVLVDEDGEKKAEPAVSLIDVEDKDPKASDQAEWNTVSGLEKGWHAGLGQIYKYPGDSKKCVQAAGLGF